MCIKGDKVREVTGKKKEKADLNKENQKSPLFKSL